MARRRCSFWTMRASSSSTRARSEAASASGAGTSSRCGLSRATVIDPTAQRRQCMFGCRAQQLQFLLQSDHLEFPAHNNLLELLEVEDLLLEFALRGLEVADRFFVCAHVTEDADSPDHAAVDIAQCGGVERGGDDFARC